MRLMTLQMEGMGKVQALMSMLGSSNRKSLHAVGAKHLENLVRRHIARYAPAKHASATALNARRTGHYEKGANRIASSATADGGEVTIPIPGIGRALGDVVVTAPTKNGRRYLTIPKHAAAYGSTVAELKRQGWKIFRPGKAQILLGYRNKGDRPVTLFALAEKVSQRKDPSLLPSEAECSAAVCKGIAAAVNRRLAAAQGNTGGKQR